MRLTAIINDSGVDTQVIKPEISPKDIIEAIKLECSEDVEYISVDSVGPSNLSRHYSNYTSQRCINTWIDHINKDSTRKIKSIHSIRIIEPYRGRYAINVVVIFEDEDIKE